MYKLIAIDLDDTLFDTRKDTPEVNVQALRRLDRAGVHVVLCSGRPTPGMRRLAAELLTEERTHYVISYNGAIVEEVESGREISRDGLPVAAAREIARFARETGLLAQYYHDDEFFVEHEDPRAEDYKGRSGLPYRIVTPLEDAMDLPSPKMLMQGSPEELPIHLETLRRTADGRWNATISKPYYLEVLSPTVDKGRAMLALAASLGLAREDLVAIGDSLNDLEMIRDAGMGVAVANAREEVRAEADLVTERAAQEGAVAEAADRLFG